jgi:hypothetical protein
VTIPTKAEPLVRRDDAIDLATGLLSATWFDVEAHNDHQTTPCLLAASEHRRRFSTRAPQRAAAFRVAAAGNGPATRRDRYRRLTAWAGTMPNPRTRPRGMSTLPYGTRLVDVLEARIELHAWCAACGRISAIEPEAHGRPRERYPWTAWRGAFAARPSCVLVGALSFMSARDHARIARYR